MHNTSEIQPNILLVNHNEIEIKQLCELLQAKNANLICAKSSTEALSLSEKENFALAIIEAHMPSVSGSELCCEINSKRTDNKIPIILTSSNTRDINDELLGYSCGAVDYIYNPIIPAILLSKVSTFLDLHQQKTMAQEGERSPSPINSSANTSKAPKDHKVEQKHIQLFNESLINSIPGIFYLYSLPDLKLVRWNKRHETILGYNAEEMQTCSIKNWANANEENFAKDLLEQLNENKQLSLESCLFTKDGTRIPFLLTAIKFRSGSKEYLMGVGTDISERKKAEQALIHNESIFSKAQSIAHVGSWEYDYKSHVLKISNETYNIFGLKPKEDAPSFDMFFKMVHPDERETLNSKINTVKTNGGPLSLDVRIILANGAERIIHKQAEMTLDEDGEPEKWLGTVHDITALKKTEDELSKSLEQLHQLSKHIENARENERLNLARELHDDLGQALTAVKIDLEIINKLSSNSQIKGKINKVKALVGSTIHTVQRITSQLRPEIIDDLGLEAAIEWYTTEFSKRYGIEIFLGIEENIPFSNDDALPIFRIIQESLTNIARHTKASHVEILISVEGDSVSFIISDNGAGISPEKITSKKSFGLMSMKERTFSLGGTFDISPGKYFGTKISICFPLNKS